jgi:predicted RecA/RadA family phage recombinase
LAKLAFFAWSHWLAPKEAQLPLSPKVNAPRLQLAVENAPAAVSGSGRCVTVGPFASNELAARARQTLSDSGYTSLPREVVTNVFEGYWVYLESPSTQSAEKRLLDRLQKGGIVDAAAVGDLGASRRISLGVFSDEARAATQSERVAKLGLLPQIVAREKPGTALWLDLTLKSDAPTLEGQKFLAGDSELEFKACPAPAGTAAGATAAVPRSN